MVKDLRIIPDQAAYFPGEEVTGTVAFTLEKPKRYVRIVVVIRGYAHVEGTYSSQEYVNQSKELWNRDTALSNVLQTGHHQFSFEFHLPVNAPPSLQTPDGKIQYLLEARITTGALKLDHVAWVNFPVMALADIGTELEIPQRKQASKASGHCHTSNPVRMIAEIPRGGFCVGEQIPLKVTVDNGSSKQVKANAVLMQVTKVANQHTNHTKETRKSITSVFSDPIQPHQTTEWETSSLTIPQVETTLTSSICDIINIEYELVVRVHQPWSTSDLSISFPVVIGNIRQASPSADSEETFLPLLPPEWYTSSSLYSEPPPSYAEAIGLAVRSSLCV